MCTITTTSRFWSQTFDIIPYLNTPLLYLGDVGGLFPCFWLRPKALAEFLYNVDVFKVLTAVDSGSLEKTPTLMN